MEALASTRAPQPPATDRHAGASPALESDLVDPLGGSGLTDPLVRAGAGAGPAQRRPAAGASGGVVQRSLTNAALIQLVVQDGLAGVCNALSAGHLAGIFQPEGAGRTGVDQADYPKIALLKQLLDATVAHYLCEGIPSADISMGFVAWMREYNGNFFGTLAAGNLDDRFEAFKTFFEEWAQAPGYTADETTGELEYANTDIGDLVAPLVEGMEDFWNVGTAFNCLVVIRATGPGLGEDGEDGYAGHELSLRYTPNGQNGGRLEILDQTTGAVQRDVQSEDDIWDIVGSHLHRCYIQNPMAKTDRAKWRFVITRP